MVDGLLKELPLQERVEAGLEKKKRVARWREAFSEGEFYKDSRDMLEMYGFLIVGKQGTLGGQMVKNMEELEITLEGPAEYVIEMPENWIALQQNNHYVMFFDPNGRRSFDCFRKFDITTGTVDTYITLHNQKIS